MQAESKPFGEDRDEDPVNGSNPVYSVIRDRLNTPWVSMVLLASSIICVIALPLVADIPQFTGLTRNFLIADLYKISLFAQGQSPYSIEPWAASYPPLYFAIWAVPYFVASNLENSTASIYVSFQLLSMSLMGLVAFTIYKTHLEKHPNRMVEARSLSTIFLLCGLTALLSLVGDAFGLLLLAVGCLFFSRRHPLLGVLFVSLAAAFKVHPILGVFMVVTYFVISKRRMMPIKALATFGSTMAITAVVPVLLISRGYDSVIDFHAANLQMYTFNPYSGLLDTLSNLAASQVLFSTDFKSVLNYCWLGAVVIAVSWLCLSVYRRGGSLRWASPVDLLSVGILVWLLLLKQTLPHYFLWALVPLLAAGRIKSSTLLICGELLGLAFFGLGYSLTGQVLYWVVPGLDASLAFLAGGISFVCFDLLALRSILLEIGPTGNPE